jgi:hypothetical protein
MDRVSQYPLQAGIETEDNRCLIYHEDYVK